jgi:ABC-type dipeptide/oligopeptide/nickel transport system permease subunit
MGTPAIATPPIQPAARGRTRRRLISGIPARVAAGVIMVLVLAAVLAPLIAPYNPNELNPFQTLTDPSLHHLFGQDSSGRDIFSRIVYGGRSSLLGPTAVVALSLLIGVPLGLVAGWRGGVIDGAVSRGADALLAFPALLLAIVIAAAFGAGFRTAIIAIAISYVPLMVRVVRGLVLVEREKTYVAAFRCQGFSPVRIAGRHVLPNISRAIAAQATVNFGYALIDLAALSFLGLGVQPPTADWGAMLADGRDSVLANPSEVIFASLFIAITVVAFNVLGDALSRSAAER